MLQMRCVRVLSKAGAKSPWLAAVGLFGLLSGCGGQFRPVVNPINQVGPAPQPTSNFVAVSGPGPNAAGVVTILDGSGDTILDQATLGAGPFSFAIDGAGASAYNLNSNGNGNVTMNSYALTTPSGTSGGLQTKNVNSSTLSTGANPVNILATASTVYLIEPYINLSTGLPSGPTSVAVLSTTAVPPALQQEIPVAANPVVVVGNANSTRVYAISQGASVPAATSLPTPGACNTPGAVTQTGEAASIETLNNVVSNRIPLGVCPVFGRLSPDNQRAFILNRGPSGPDPTNPANMISSVTVINAQQNQIDAVHPSLPVGLGPVDADYYTPTSLLVTANYDSNTVSIINVGLDVYGNDGPQFGLTHTVPVGNGPVAVTILQDGTRAYVANQTDGTVSVVDLTSFKVTKIIPIYQNSLNGQTGGTAFAHPSSISSISGSLVGKVYVASKDSQYLTVIRTDTDTVSASLLLQGFAVDVRAREQTAGGPSNASALPNNVVTSRIAGLGIPCNPYRDPSPFCPLATQ
jgi:YVTN family beta-propeller protein